jgi:signal transduction histidine kinase
MIRRHLYLRLYLAFVCITAISLLLTAILARAFHRPGGSIAPYLTPLARSIDCQPDGSCHNEAAQRLAQAANELGIDIAVWDQERRPLFQASTAPLPPPARFAAGWHHTPHGPLWLSSIGGGRMLGLRERGHLGPRGRLFPHLLAALLLAMAIGLYPLSRSITRRVEQLAEGARRWGEGDLAHRVPVAGGDEIAQLGSRFNQAAQAIQSLVTQERQILATASHELRSPLARVRVALELLGDENSAERRAELVGQASRDITELDALVEELLMAARTQPGVPRRPSEVVDLCELVSNEARQFAAPVAAPCPLLHACDSSMMRHMIRNLLQNARLHGQGAPIRAEILQHETEIVVAVEDEGPGVPEGERDRIFAPFYRPPGPRPPGDTGLGLGLALVRQVARHHGGDVRYIAREPVGSRFEVRLPECASMRLERVETRPAMFRP